MRECVDSERALTSSSFGPVAPSQIPDGLTKEQWAKEKAKLKAKPGANLGRGGTSGMKFRSRSMEEFQKLREVGGCLAVWRAS